MLSGPIQAQLTTLSCLEYVGPLGWSEVVEVGAGTESRPVEQIPLVAEAVLSAARRTDLWLSLHVSMGPGWLTTATSAGFLRALLHQVSIFATAEASLSRNLTIFTLRRRLANL